MLVLADGVEAAPAPPRAACLAATGTFATGSAVALAGGDEILVAQLAALLRRAGVAVTRPGDRTVLEPAVAA